MDKTKSSKTDKPKSFCYLTEIEVAELLRVTPRTTQRWRVLGTGPAFIRAGQRRVLYDRTAVEAWAASRSFTSHAAEAVGHGAPQPAAAQQSVAA
ncbi:helix-turn-helix transcriptional regulator [Roseomonas sp. WA12]